jgi:N-acetylmuramoyl-L-alanine amidase
MTTRMERRGRGSGPRTVRHALKPRLTPMRMVALVAVVLVVVLVGAGYALVHVQSLQQAGEGRAVAKESPLPGKSIVATDAATSTVPAGVEVEVPDVVGKARTTAEILLKAVGFKVVTRVASQNVAGAAVDSILAQAPSSGTRLPSGDSVTITYNPRAVVQIQAQGPQPVVVIDAGHQVRGDTALEPVGPGATEMKAKVAGGASGAAAGPEYARTLEVSLRLRDILRAAGVQVVMVRTTNDVNIANSERAKIGNRAGAALTVRVHFNSASNKSVHGISTLYPHGNSPASRAWCDPIEPASKRAAGLVEDAVTRATGADRQGGTGGLVGRADMTGFNWSTVPTIIVEGGFMSNTAEDKLIATPDYRDKIAAGIAEGVLAYLGK